MEISGLLSRCLCERSHRSLGTDDKRLAQALVVLFLVMGVVVVVFWGALAPLARKPSAARWWWHMAL